jgi:hypothetical protein
MRKAASKVPRTRRVAGDRQTMPARKRCYVVSRGSSEHRNIPDRVRKLVEQKVEPMAPDTLFGEEEEAEGSSESSASPLVETVVFRRSSRVLKQSKSSLVGSLGPWEVLDGRERTRRARKRA